MRSSSVTKKVATITAAAFILLALTTMAVMTTFVTADAGSSASVTQSVTQSNNDGTSSVRVTQSGDDDGSSSVSSSVRVTQSGDDDGSSSVRVTQSNGEGVEVSCEGDVNCEVIGDDTVVATSEDGDSINSTAVTTTTPDTTTTVNQPDLDDLDDRIEGMVDRLLDEVSATLMGYYNWRLSLFT
jgi:hypothetical protein